MECVELAPAVGCVARFESGSKLHALHTLRAVWFRLCRPGDRRALPAVTDRLLPSGSHLFAGAAREGVGVRPTCGDMFQEAKLNASAVSALSAISAQTP